MEAKASAFYGEKVNFCPFGCRDEDLDDHGYCDHLVGFTTDGKMLEPMSVGPYGYKVVDGKHPEPVLSTDKLERITTSYRVYRDTPKDEITDDELEEATRP